MKKIIAILYFFIIAGNCFSQALPANRYTPNNSIIDLENFPPSFAYSLRKMRANYTGFAILARRASDNAIANVAFDAIGLVSTTSIVTVTATGTSSFSVGQTMAYSVFIASQVIHVVTWYDQGINAYHATQPTTTAQPIIQLNIAGATNNLPSIVFNGSRNLVVNQPIQNLLLNGINGTFLLMTKHTSNTTQQLSFGLESGTGWRWAIHINWSDGYAYFDAAENCCANPRRFLNDTNINLYKLYTFIRGTSYKTMMVNSIPRINNAPLPSTANTGGTFGIGNWNSNTSSNGYLGNVSEAILFKTDYSQPMIKFLETNQIAFWGL